MRLFFAVLIDQLAREQIADIQTQLKTRLPLKRAAWVKPDNFHYTLHFLGEVSPEQAVSAQEAGRETASRLKPFQFQIGGLGVFPTYSRPRVLWIGAQTGFESFEAVYRALSDALSQRAFSIEKKRFHPHLTLARFKVPIGNLQEPIEAVDASALLSQSVHSLSLMESQLQPTGAVYTEIERFEFSLS